MVFRERAAKSCEGIDPAMATCRGQVYDCNSLNVSSTLAHSKQTHHRVVVDNLSTLTLCRPRVSLLPGEAGRGPAGAHRLAAAVRGHHILDGAPSALALLPVLPNKTEQLDRDGLCEAAPYLWAVCQVYRLQKHSATP